MKRDAGLLGWWHLNPDPSHAVDPSNGLVGELFESRRGEVKGGQRAARAAVGDRHRDTLARIYGKTCQKIMSNCQLVGNVQVALIFLLHTGFRLGLAVAPL